MKYWTLGMIAVNLLTTSCCPRLHECDFFTVAVPPPTPLCGHFEGNRFYDATGHFSVEIPESFHNNITEGISETGNVSMASFQDWIGNLERVEVSGIDEETMSYFAENEYTWGENLEMIFCKCHLSLIDEKFKGTELLHQKRAHEESKDESFFIAVVKIPEGSNLYDVETKKGVDGIRAYFCFFDQTQMVFLSCQQAPAFDDIREQMGKGNDYSTHINCLLDLKTRYRNENKT